MSRLYHSASSLALGRRCPRAWWYHYIAGIREPRVLWPTIAHYVADRDGKTWRDPNDASKSVPSRSRSTALGTEMHARLEARYLGRPVDWHDVPGEIALSGLHHLPMPDHASVRVEAPIGDAAIVGAIEDHAPPVGFKVAGILWAGYRDLVATGAEEWARLGVHAHTVLVDYKSSSDIARYALTPAALKIDFAANLYALATCTELDLAEIPARWVYFETKRRRHAEPRDAVITRNGAFEIVAHGSEDARKLDAITDEASATPNTEACGDYGGCPHHHSVGGPCNALRSFGALIQAHTPKKENTTMLPPGITNLKPAPLSNGASPVSTFTPAPQATFAPADAAPPPAEAPTAPRTRAPRAPRTVAAPIAQDSAPTEAYDFEIDGHFGPLTLRGDARDVITAAKMLRGVGT